MSDAIRIITNNVPRFTIDASELTPAERAEFDYLNWQAIERGEHSASFVRYRGELIDLGEFSAQWGISSEGERMPCPFSGRWDGFMADTYFSGLVIRYADDSCESVVVGRFIA